MSVFFLSRGQESRLFDLEMIEQKIFLKLNFKKKVWQGCRGFMWQGVRITLFGAVIIVMRVFFDEKDYAFYLQQLQISAEQSGVAVHAFVLMANHVHLLVTPSAGNACANMR
jgi:hypothetical protein